MYPWLSPISIIAGGAIGGLTNAFMTQNGFVLPTKIIDSNTLGKVWRPGILGNVAVSAVAALVSWGLYGTGASLPVFAASVTDKDVNLTYSALVGSILIGIGGARWLTAEVDKALLRGAAVTAASKGASDSLANALALSTPTDAYTAAIRQP